jgi:hypothetical protein
MNSVLRYGEKPDWGNKPLSPRMSKIYGISMFIIACAYLWKFHHRHAPQNLQMYLLVCVVALGIAVPAQLSMKAAHPKAFYLLYVTVQSLLLGVLLFRI